MCLDCGRKWEDPWPNRDLNREPFSHHYPRHAGSTSGICIQLNVLPHTSKQSRRGRARRHSSRRLQHGVMTERCNRPPHYCFETNSCLLSIHRVHSNISKLASGQMLQACESWDVNIPWKGSYTRRPTFGSLYRNRCFHGNVTPERIDVRVITETRSFLTSRIHLHIYINQSKSNKGL